MMEKTQTSVPVGFERRPEEQQSVIKKEIRQAVAQTVSFRPGRGPGPGGPGRFGEGEKAARSTAQMRIQANVTVFFGPSLTRIQAATKFPTILAAEMALLTEEGMRAMWKSEMISGVTTEPTIHDALKKQ